MKIANFNIFPSRINWENEIQGIYPVTLINEKLKLAGSLSSEFIVYNCFELMNDNTVLLHLLHVYKHEPEFIHLVNDLKSTLPDVRMLVNKKRKDKISLQLIGQHKAMMNQMKKTLKDYYFQRLTMFKLIELAAFEKENIWETGFALVNVDEKKEDSYIPVLTKIISEHEYILWFNGIVEELFTFTQLDSKDNTDFDYIKIPLWDFPSFDGITFLEMKYTYEDLKPVLQSYNAKLNELTEQLSKIPFILENKNEIIQLCTDNLTPFISPIQNSINDSLYISKLKNQSIENTGVTFNLGITSAENLVNYYEKSEILLPYVVAEIKEQLSRRMDLKSSGLFCYNMFTYSASV